MCVPRSQIAAGPDGLERAGLGEPEYAAAGDVRMIVLWTVGREAKARRRELEARRRPEAERRLGRIEAEVERGRGYGPDRAHRYWRRLMMMTGRWRGARRRWRRATQRDVRVLAVAAAGARA